MRSPETGLQRLRDPRALLGLGVSAVLIASACGGDSADASQLPAEKVEITMLGNQFHLPAGIRFESGQRVEATLVNADEINHTAIFMGGHHTDDGTFEQEPPAISPGRSMPLSFVAEDGSMIHCTLHPDMFIPVPVE
jgi:hypothetical protein